MSTEDISAALDRIRATPMEVYSNEALKEKIGLIASRLSLPKDFRVLYPGSSADTAVADSFGKERVFQLDYDQKPLKALKDKGYQAIRGRSEEIKFGKKFDVMVFWNSGITPDNLLEALNPGGYVIANNWHGSANRLASRNDYRLEFAVTEEGQPLSAEEAQNLLGEVYMAIDIDEVGNTKIRPIEAEEYQDRQQEGKLSDVANKGADVMFVFERIDNNN